MCTLTQCLVNPIQGGGRHLGIRLLDHFVFLEHLGDYGIFRILDHLLLVVEVLHLALDVRLPAQGHVLKLTLVHTVQSVTSLEKLILQGDSPAILLNHVPGPLRLLQLFCLPLLDLLFQQLFLLGFLPQFRLLHTVLLKLLLVLYFC